MANYTVTLTTAENLALSHVAASQQDWIDNAVKERARVAINDIVALAVTKYLDQSITIPATREEIVQDAFDRGWVTAAAS
jgi:nicotinamide riboside kinase